MRCDIGVAGFKLQDMQILRYCFYISKIALERAAIESDSLVNKKIALIRFALPSITEHVKFRENLPRPWGKAKYYLMTDSELVP